MQQCQSAGIHSRFSSKKNLRVFPCTPAICRDPESGGIYHSNHKQGAELQRDTVCPALESNGNPADLAFLFFEKEDRSQLVRARERGGVETYVGAQLLWVWERGRVEASEKGGEV